MLIPNLPRFQARLRKTCQNHKKVVRKIIIKVADKNIDEGRLYLPSQLSSIKLNFEYM